MTTYNTIAQVVELIEADTPRGAYDKLCHRLTAAGFDVYTGDGTGATFESEPDAQVGGIDPNTVIDLEEVAGNLRRTYRFDAIVEDRAGGICVLRAGPPRWGVADGAGGHGCYEGYTAKAGPGWFQGTDGTTDPYATTEHFVITADGDHEQDAPEGYDVRPGMDAWTVAAIVASYIQAQVRDTTRARALARESRPPKAAPEREPIDVPDMKPTMPRAQSDALAGLCRRYGVEFKESHYAPAFDLPTGYVAGWIGGPDHGSGGSGKPTLYVGCDPEGAISS